MSTNEKTASVVDTLAAAELITTGALNSQTSKSAEQRINEASVDETSLVESGCGVQKTGTNEECIKNNIVNIPLSPKIYWVETEKLQLNPLSDNIYGSDVPATLLASIKENDIRSPLIVSKSTMKVLSGNTRLRVAQQLSKEKIPVVFVEANLTEEDEQNLILSHNVARDKTNEMRVREYNCYLEIEKKLANQRRASPRSSTAKVQKFAPSKSREIAAEKVGVSHTSLETGVKVVQAIDSLLEQGQVDNAKRLRKVLEENGFSGAKNLAINQKWLSEADSKKTAKVRKSTKSTQKPSVEEQSASLKDLAQSQEALTETCQEPPPDPTTPESADLPQPLLPAVATSEVELAFINMRAVKTFLDGVDVTKLTEDVRAKIGEEIGSINVAARVAGLTIKAV